MLVKMRVKGKFTMELLTLIEKDNICDSMEEEGHPVSSLLHFNVILEVEEVRLDLNVHEIHNPHIVNKYEFIKWTKSTNGFDEIK